MANDRLYFSGNLLLPPETDLKVERINDLLSIIFESTTEKPLPVTPKPPKDSDVEADDPFGKTYEGLKAKVQQQKNELLDVVLNHQELPPRANSPKARKKTREPNATEKLIIQAINETDDGLPPLDRLCILLDGKKEAEPRWTWKAERSRYGWPEEKGRAGYVKAWNTPNVEVRLYWRKLIRKYVDDVKKKYPDRIKVTKSPR